MRIFVVAAVLLVGCGGGSATPAEKLTGEWINEAPDGSSGFGVTFTADGQYDISFLVVSGATSLNAQVETGVFSATDNQITFTPQKWTCPGPDPVETDGYSFSGDQLVVTLPAKLITFARNVTTSGGPTVTLDLGCFQPDGSFLTAPLAPVAN